MEDGPSRREERSPENGPRHLPKNELTNGNGRRAKSSKRGSGNAARSRVPSARIRASRRQVETPGRDARSRRQVETPGRDARSRLLYYGDNLDVLRQHVADESADLIYLDPPFNSNADYNMIFKNKDGKKSGAQILAFQDTWSWTAESEATLDYLAGTRIGGVVLGLQQAVGKNDLFAYVVAMAIRLLELHRVLKKSGSVYVHCDPTASHYLKIVMDAVFGPKNYRNEITWKRATSGQKGSQHAAKKFGRNRDTILFYAKDARRAKFNPPKASLTEEQRKKKFNRRDPDGRRWMDDSAHIWSTPGMGARPNLCYTWKGFANPHPSGWRLSRERLEEEYRKGNFEIAERPDGSRKLIRKVYEDDYAGQNVGDFWDDVLPAQGNERVGYPTQKPEALLERIIRASSDEDDTVLDPFCGCGTTVMEAERLNRSWVGIDITHLAVNLIAKRLSDKFKIKPDIRGIPKSLESARMLARQNKFQFETWAVSLIPNAHPNQKQTGDGGVDGSGQILVRDPDGNPKYETVVVSVKGGKNLQPSMIRDLVGTMEGKAAFGIFVCLEKPSRGMYEAAAKAKVYHTEYGTYPRVQIYTIAEYFAGVRPKIMSIMDTTRVAMQKREPRHAQATL